MNRDAAFGGPTTPAIRLALIGYGYWGPNIARNIARDQNFELATICEADAARRAAAQRDHPSATILEDAGALDGYAGIDAVAIATPVSTHAVLALAALDRGQHVFVEKPLAGSSHEALEILESAEARGLKVMVGHTFVYTGAVREMRRIVETGSLGNLRYFDSCRVNLGLVQHDVDVAWDLAVHDLAIVQYVTGLEPRAVSAVGVAHAPSRTISAAFLTLLYDNEFVAHIDVNWMSPVKIRRTLLGGDRRMIVWDDLEPSEKVRVYDSGVDPVVDGDERMTRLVQYRVGDMVAPRLDATEALALEFADFAAWLRGGGDPPNAGRSGLSVVRALEAAGQSMALGGAPVEITPGAES